jgi:cytochrome c biogenesis protein CcmG, thiol:disulfide interchange protein DsbE
MKRLLSPVVIAAVVGVVALVALLGYGLGSNDPDRGIDQALERGERVEAPAFNLQQLSGRGRSSLASFRGKVVVLNIWASWCDPCRAESPLLERWHKRISARGHGMVLGVDVLDVTSDARAFVREYGLSYPQLHDKDDSVRADYGASGVPETVVIDRRGRIAAIRRGPVDDAFMRAKVLPLVGNPA